MAKSFNTLAWASEPLMLTEMVPTSIRNVFYGIVGFFTEFGSIFAPYLNSLVNENYIFYNIYNYFGSRNIMTNDYRRYFWAFCRCWPHFLFYYRQKHLANRYLKISISLMQDHCGIYGDDSDEMK